MNTAPEHQRRRSPTVAATVTMAALLGACASAPLPSSRATLLEPANGAVLSSPFKVRFGVAGMTVAPAGTMTAGTGHHHLLIDQQPVASGQVVPTTPKHIHFGAGQTETLVTLQPGTYKLTAQFANGAHQSYGPAMSDTITVTVK
ncbi:MAG: DUF4399 domain-containing protein [Rubrivivax sp.]